MRSFVTCVSLHEIIWAGYLVIIMLSPEERIGAKVLLLLVFVYLASVISFLIGKTRRFLLLSFVASVTCFLLLKQAVLTLVPLIFSSDLLQDI